MTANKSKIIAVVGGGDPSDEEARLAEEVGCELARQGAILICGGLSGVMQAACKGAQSQGGMTIGILPGDNRKSANRYVQIPIVTNLGYARNVIVVKSAQAIIAIGGKYGTLTEIAYALDAKIPVIGLRTWSISRNHRVDKGIIRARNAKEAVQKALELAEEK